MADQNAQTAPRRVRAAARREEALRLRQAGASYRAIAQKLGITREAARKHVVAALEQLDDVTADLRAQLRRLELERLDALQLAHWTAAMQGDPAATDRILRIMDRRAKLVGLDHQTQATLNIVHPSLDELIKRVLPDADELETDQGQTA